MICKKCGAITEFGREFLFYGGRDLGDHKIQTQKANTIFTQEIHNHDSDETLRITLCNRCLADTDYIRTSDWVLGIASVLSVGVILPLLATKFPQSSIYLHILPSIAPSLIIFAFLIIRAQINRKRISRMDATALNDVITDREASAYWQGHANQKAISAHFAQTTTKVQKLNGMGWGIDDQAKNYGCQLGYVYLSSSEFESINKSATQPVIKPLTRVQRSQLDESRMTQFYRDSARAWVAGRHLPFFKSTKKLETTEDAAFELFSTDDSFQPCEGNALYFFFSACTPLPDEFLITTGQSVLLTSKRLIIKHGLPPAFAEVFMPDVASCDLKDIKKGTVKLVMKSGKVCLLSHCKGHHPYLDTLVKKGVFTP